MSTNARSPRFSAALTVTIDIVLVLVFCVIGRLSHEEGIFADLPGLVNTVWPFLVALLAAHTAVVLSRTRPERLLPGAIIWATTVIGGLALRAVSGQGTAVAFIIVTALTLALFLVGWRAILALVRRRRSRGA